MTRLFRSGTLVRAIVPLLAITLSGCVSADWQNRLFGTSHGSATPDDGLTASGVATLKPKWRLPAPSCTAPAGAPTGAGAAGGEWFATPVTFKGVIYIGSAHGCLFAINEATGTVKWKKYTAFQPVQTCTQPLGIVSSVAVVDDGNGNPLLFFHSSDGYLYKLRGSDGSQIWRSLVRIPSTTSNDVFAWSSPTVFNNKVVIGISSNCDTPFVQGQVRAYNATSGALLWTHKTIPDGFVGAGDWYDAAVDASGNVYVSTGSTTDSVAKAHPNTTAGFEQYSLLKLNGTTGQLIWKAPAPQIANDPDYASSPILFSGGGVALVGATNKDGWFRVYRQDTGAKVWEALVGTATSDGGSSPLSGGVWNNSALFVMGNASSTGGVWTHNGSACVESFPSCYAPVGGTSVAGVIRRLNPATGALVSVGGRPFELALPSNPLAPCTINGNSILVCAGGQNASTGHNKGLFVVDTTKAAAILRHLEDTVNTGEFGQPAQENGAILSASNAALIKWGQ
jgi:outer membrane protein assembly factor BamB